MEFNEKLQQLRRQKGLTQEELAKALYVSRTAVSKWESARGVPNIESLKAISKFFSVSIDELLSSEQLLDIADNDIEQNRSHMKDLVFGLIDCGTISFLFLPLFAQRDVDTVRSMPLIFLESAAPYIKVLYFAVVFGTVLIGILTLALQNKEEGFWAKNKYKLSVALGAVSAVLFMITLQPYPAALAFVFLAIKAVLLIKPAMTR